MAKTSASSVQVSTSDRLIELRWQRSERDLSAPLHALYKVADTLIARLKTLLVSHWNQKPEALRDLDLQRDLDPNWFLSENAVGYVFLH
jgi:amylosucrase